jgi:hypothetical protein
MFLVMMADFMLMGNHLASGPQRSLISAGYGDAGGS